MTKPDELAHYARATVDILFKFPFGTQELEGIAARSDFDLSQHFTSLRSLVTLTAPTESEEIQEPYTID